MYDRIFELQKEFARKYFEGLWLFSIYILPLSGQFCIGFQIIEFWKWQQYLWCTNFRSFTSLSHSVNCSKLIRRGLDRELHIEMQVVIFFQSYSLTSSVKPHLNSRWQVEKLSFTLPTLLWKPRVRATKAWL